MIITALKGGLGNQMFQYACGRALSLRNGEPMKLDASGFAHTKGSDTTREYLLGHFNITSGETAAADEIGRFKYPLGIISKGWRFVRLKIFRRFNIGYEPRVLALKGDMYLDGFWQTEKYFLDRADSIRREFTLKEPLSRTAQRIADDILSSGIPTVSLHVRRGDVARDWKTNPYYGICTPEYYEQALLRVKAELGKRGAESFRVFVFSDGMDWVRDNISIPYPTTYIPGSDIIPEWEALSLMSICDHHIIANSSFSWWGAWLNPKPDKTVVAPRRWINKHENWHKDTVPDGWIRV